jgi:hypothetical protein
MIADEKDENAMQEKTSALAKGIDELVEALTGFMNEINEFVRTWSDGSFRSRKTAEALLDGMGLGGIRKSAETVAELCADGAILLRRIDGEPRKAERLATLLLAKNGDDFLRSLMEWQCDAAFSNVSSPGFQALAIASGLKKISLEEPNDGRILDALGLNAHERVAVFAALSR